MSSSKYTLVLQRIVIGSRGMQLLALLAATYAFLLPPFACFSPTTAAFLGGLIWSITSIGRTIVAGVDL